MPGGGNQEAIPPWISRAVFEAECRRLPTKSLRIYLTVTNSLVNYLTKSKSSVIYLNPTEVNRIRFLASRLGRK